jgi:GNAT superfamily N-acetyltransferase
MTADEPFHIETEPASADVEALRQRLWEHNVASTGDSNGFELAIVLRGPDGALRAGLYGWTWGGWLEIDQFWVHPEDRGKGLGSRMLAAAEAEGRKRGCHTAALSTHTFQAPDFYRRHGYETHTTLDEYPPGHAKLFMRKRLLAPSSAHESRR